MAGDGVKLFLSCVSGEFGVYRDALRQALTRPNVEVKIQEDFKALGGDTLKMLEEYVGKCEAVVHFVGEMAGSTPAGTSVDDLLARRPEFEARLAAKGLGRDALRISPTRNGRRGSRLASTRISYRRAGGRGRPRSEVCADGRFARVAGAAPQEAAGDQSLPGPCVHQRRQSRRAGFWSAVIDALVKAAKAASPRQPRNLPLGSFGDLFKGRTKPLKELHAALLDASGVAVVGLGGVGKTRLAIEYAWRNGEDYSALCSSAPRAPPR